MELKSIGPVCRRFGRGGPTTELLGPSRLRTWAARRAAPNLGPGEGPSSIDDACGRERNASLLELIKQIEERLGRRLKIAAASAKRKWNRSTGCTPPRRAS